MKSRFRYVLMASIFCNLLVLGISAAADAPARSYGEELTIQETTPIAEILASPSSFEGKDVRVEGEIAGVCAKAGCWMEIADSQGRAIRIKVDDGVIVFPVEAVGVNAAAEGRVTVQEMSREEYVGWQRHLAEETGNPFDEAAVGEGPYQLVQIAGSGAHIGG